MAIGAFMSRVSNSQPWQEFTQYAKQPKVWAVVSTVGLAVSWVFKAQVVVTLALYTLSRSLQSLYCIHSDAKAIEETQRHLFGMRLERTALLAQIAPDVQADQLEERDIKLPPQHLDTFRALVRTIMHRWEGYSEGKRVPEHMQQELKRSSDLFALNPSSVTDSEGLLNNLKASLWQIHNFMLTSETGLQQSLKWQSDAQVKTMQWLPSRVDNIGLVILAIARRRLA